MWLNQNFLLPDEIEGKDTDLDIMFLSLRTGNPLAIKMDPSGNVRVDLLPLIVHLYVDVILLLQLESFRVCFLVQIRAFVI